MCAKINKNDVKIVLVMGKSGAGKQPRIDCLVSEFNLTQISTGNLFRERISLYNSCHFQGDINEVWNSEINDFESDETILELLRANSRSADLALTELNLSSIILGMKAKYFVENGLFCPDSLTCDIFKNAFDAYFNDASQDVSGKKGLVLDGFPRTSAQVDYLIKLLGSQKMKVDFILEVSLDDDTIIKRTTGRRICPKCSSVYHLMFIPPKDGKFCKVCTLPAREGQDTDNFDPYTVEVKTRADDASEELLRKRLKEYEDKGQPSLDRLHLVYKVPVVTVSGNLPDPSKKAVKDNILSAISVLFEDDEN